MSSSNLSNKKNYKSYQSSSTSYQNLHPKNPYYNSPPDLKSLVENNPSKFPDKVVSYDWKDEENTRIFTELLLKKDFNLDVEIPKDHLSPPLPNRLNYLCYLSELLDIFQQIEKKQDFSSSNSNTDHNYTTPLVIDLGTGPIAIYSILGASLFSYQFLSSELDQSSYLHARNTICNNPSISDKVILTTVRSSDELQKKLLPIISSYILNKNTHSENIQQNILKFLVKNYKLKGVLREALSAFGYYSLLSEQEYNFIINSHKLNLNFENNFDTSITSLKRFRNVEDVEDEDEEEFYNRKKIKRKSSQNIEEEGNKILITNESEGNLDTEDHNSEKFNLAFEEFYTLLNNYERPIISACICNPPFYDIDEQIYLKNGSSNLPGSQSEMRTIGGEIGFIGTIIADSLILKEKIGWYTSMVGKNSSLKILKEILKEEGIPSTQIVSIRLSQGSTHRWVLAWTFNPLLSFLYHYNLKLKKKVQTMSNASTLLPSFCNSIFIQDLFSTSLPEELEEANISSSFLTSFFSDAFLSSNLSGLDHKKIIFYTNLFYNRLLLILKNYDNISNLSKFNSSLKNLTLVLDYSIIQDENVKTDSIIPFFSINFPLIQGSIKNVNIVTNEKESLLDFCIEVNIIEKNETHNNECDSMEIDFDDISNFQFKLKFTVLEINSSESMLNSVISNLKNIFELELCRSNRRWRRKLMNKS